MGSANPPNHGGFSNWICRCGCFKYFKWSFILHHPNKWDDPNWLASFGGPPSGQFSKRLAWSGGCWNSCLKQMRRLQYSNPGSVEYWNRSRVCENAFNEVWIEFSQRTPCSFDQAGSNRFWRHWRILQLGAMARSWRPSHQKIEWDRVALPCPISCLQASPTLVIVCKGHEWCQDDLRLTEMLERGVRCRVEDCEGMKTGIFHDLPWF